jgi:hypothetical protein
VREQVAHRDRSLGGHRGDLVLGVILGVAQDAQVLELGEVFRYRIVEPDLPLFDQPHHPDAGDGFGHRGDREDRVLGHGLLGLQVPGAERGRIRHLAPARDQGDSACDLAVIDKLLKSRLEPIQLSRRQSDRLRLSRRQLTSMSECGDEENQGRDQSRAMTHERSYQRSTRGWPATANLIRQHPTDLVKLLRHGRERTRSTSPTRFIFRHLARLPGKLGTALI